MSHGKAMQAIRVLKSLQATIDGHSTRVLCRALRGHASVTAAVLALRETRQTDELKPL